MVFLAAFAVLVAMGAVDAHLACIHSYTREPLLFCVPHTLRGWQHVSGYCRLPPLVVKSERYLSPKKSYLRVAVSMAEDGDDPELAGSKKSKKRKRTVKVDPLTLPPSADTFPEYAQRDFFRYELVHQSKKSGARVGRIHTPHGIVDTPGYVPVATNAALKAADHGLLDAEANQQLMFCNTYHLVLQPGSDLVEEAGGLHKFMGRDPTRPLITDSGGFQVLLSPAYLSLHEKETEGPFLTWGTARDRFFHWHLALWRTT